MPPDRAGGGWGDTMDTLRSIDSDDVDRDYPAADEPQMEAPPSIGSDERRMHVRAYNHWVSLLGGRAYPAIADLKPETVPDFGPHGVVMTFAGGTGDPAIPFVGRALREEGGHDMPIDRVSDVPRGSLLSRLTDHIDEIVANHAPIGFEAEFVNQRGRNMMYRGILMPFSSDQRSIDAIYGVINWKEAPEKAEIDALSAEIARALDDAPAPLAMPGPIWADGPNAAPPPATILPETDFDAGYDADYDARHGVPLVDDALAGALVDVGSRFTPSPLAGDARHYLRDIAPVATIDIGTIGSDEFVLLVARRLGDGRFGILAPVHDPLLLDRAMRRLAD